MHISAKRLAMDWIKHDGGPCPCVGEWVEDDTGERGIALDHLYWRYVTHYRLISPPLA